jgi:hypothetical protein
MNGRGGMRPLRVVAACGVMLLATGLVMAWCHAPTREQRSAVSALALLLVLSLGISAYLRDGLSFEAVVKSVEAVVEFLCGVLVGLLQLTPVLLIFGALGFGTLECVRGWLGTRRAEWLVFCAFLLLGATPAQSDKGIFVKLFGLLTLGGMFGYWVAYRC